jgi:succinate dehydrogenase/fumarate reductase cytochrome b subunit
MHEPVRSSTAGAGPSDTSAMRASTTGAAPGRWWTAVSVLLPVLAAGYPSILRPLAQPQRVVASLPLEHPLRLLLAAAPWLLVFGGPLLAMAVLLRADQRVPEAAQRRRLLRAATLALLAPVLMLFGPLGAIARNVPGGFAAFWPAFVLAVLLAPARRASRPGTNVRPPFESSPRRAAGERARRLVHRVGAALLAGYGLAHVSSHLAAVWSLAASERIQFVLRQVYWTRAVELPLLLAIATQTASGLWMAWRRSGRPQTGLERLHVVSGLYLALFLYVHAGAVMGFRARGHGLTFFRATYEATGVPPSAFLAYYSIGVLAFLTHLAGVLRLAITRRRGRAAGERAGRLALRAAASITALITAAVAGLHARDDRWDRRAPPDPAPPPPWRSSATP